MTYVKLGAVRPFPNVKPDKAQALKVLEDLRKCRRCIEFLIEEVS